MANSTDPTDLRSSIVFDDVTITLTDMPKLYRQLQKLGTSLPLQRSLDIMNRLRQTIDERVIYVTSNGSSWLYRVSEFHHNQPDDHLGMGQLGSQTYSPDEVDAI